MLLAFGLGPGLTSTSPLRETIRVLSQLPTHEWIKRKRTLDTSRHFVLLDTGFKSSLTKRNNKQNKPLLLNTKALSLQNLLCKFKESFLILVSFTYILRLNIPGVSCVETAE